MKGSFFIYVFSTIIVIWSMESVNISKIFKKNRIVQARVFYFLLGISMIYLVANFFIGLYMSLNFN